MKFYFGYEEYAKLGGVISKHPLWFVGGAAESKLSPNKIKHRFNGSSLVVAAGAPEHAVW